MPGDAAPVTPGVALFGDCFAHSVIYVHGASPGCLGAAVGAPGWVAMVGYCCGRGGGCKHGWPFLREIQLRRSVLRVGKRWLVRALVDVWVRSIWRPPSRLMSL